MGQQAAKLPPAGTAIWSGTEEEPTSPDFVLSVFFEGTGNTIRPARTLIGIIYSLCPATAVTPDAIASTAFHRHDHAKMAFDGCGVTHGTMGTLFATGVNTVAEDVINCVHGVLEGRPRTKFVQVNAVGFSRGGIACLRLAKKLQPVAVKYKDKTKIRLSMLLFDPVPGNVVSTGFPGTASELKDLSDCDCLHRVLAVYPVEPLPDYTLHAPMLPVYPKDCWVEEDATLGCHQGALFNTTERPWTTPYGGASNLSFNRIMEFMSSQGTKFSNGGPIFRPSREQCSDVCHNAQSQDKPSKRITHDVSGQGRLIVRRNERDKPMYLNRHHERLERDLAVDADLAGGPRQRGGARYMLDILLPSEANAIPERPPPET
mmetsp:Transcript_26681/g.48917  ORF Transcript_26681/g.48917 Transcript_26681/m.48917 type:complete len:374 (+) Transcript_26681:208-1329(+)